MKLKDIVTFVSKSVVPQRGAKYNLYSLPSFDENKSAEVLDGAEIQSNKYDVPNKCILFNKLNVRFKRVWRINNSDSNKIASTEFLPLVVNEDVVDYQYCYYLLISDEITNYLCGQNSNTSGSHKRIDPQNFLNIDIHLPKMPIQKAIGKTLSNIDRKIELNKRINDNLEAQLRLITSRYIFSCPNLEKKRIGEIATVKAGGDCPITFSKTRTQKCNIPIFSNGTEDRGLYGFTNKANIEGHSITVAARGTIGYCERRLMPFVPIIRLLAITPKEDGAYIYLHQVIRGMKFKKNGSVQQQLTVPEISFIEIPYPHSSVLHEYNKVASFIVEMIERYISENEILTKQRDELLPLLMNGQATVNYHLSAKVYPLPIAYKKVMPIVTNQTISNTFIQKFDNHTPSPCLQTSNHSIPKEERNDL